MREVYIIIILTYKGTIAAKVQSHYYYGNKYCSSPFKQFVVKVIRLIISRSVSLSPIRNYVKSEM